MGQRRRARHAELHHSRSSPRRRAARPSKAARSRAAARSTRTPVPRTPTRRATWWPSATRARWPTSCRCSSTVSPTRTSTRSAICRPPNPTSRGTARGSTAITCRPTTRARSTSGATASSRAACSTTSRGSAARRASRPAHRCTDGSSPTPRRRRAWSRAPVTPCSSAAATGRTSTTHDAQQGFLSPAGVHASCIEYLAEHDASMLVWDMQDAPIADQGIPNPRPIAVPLHVHAIVIPYMGMPDPRQRRLRAARRRVCRARPVGVPVRRRAPRDPAGDRFAGQPARDPVTTEQTSPVTVVCCSGGGIRSASFNLGALQALAAHKTPVDPAAIVAVSGGAYITASHALVADESPDRPAPHDVYRSGSPEEDHLRDNSRYLLPDGKTGLWAAVRLLGGLVFNLALLVLWVFVGGHVLGWLLHWWGILTGLQVGSAVVVGGMGLGRACRSRRSVAVARVRAFGEPSNRRVVADAPRRRVRGGADRDAGDRLRAVRRRAPRQRRRRHRRTRVGLRERRRLQGGTDRGTDALVDLRRDAREGRHQEGVGVGGVRRSAQGRRHPDRRLPRVRRRAHRTRSRCARPSSRAEPEHFGRARPPQRATPIRSRGRS